MTKLFLANLAIITVLFGTSQRSTDARAQGSLLPSGYLSTSGNQVVDPKGNNVRLACVGYDPRISDANSIDNDIKAMVAYGFNCLRYPWYNATLSSVNLPKMKNIVLKSTKYGMKVIFDHHGDEAPSAKNNYLSYPQNGLPYDKGPGTDGTDGSGDPGSVTRATFKSDWVSVASQFKNNPTVIGFDLTNEPHLNFFDPKKTKAATSTQWGSTWGDGGTNDLVSIYQEVGNAIHAVNPDVLIICEGILNDTVTLFNGSPEIIHGFPDFTGVKKNPIVLNHLHKLVYSVHDYPTTIGGTTPDSGAKKITAMNVSWGYIVSGGKAPVWIGEMGASLDQTGGDVAGNNATAGQIAKNLADERDWVKWMVSYLNGGLGLYGGPTFKTCEAGIGTDWWSWGNFDGESPDGTLNDNGKARAEQQSNTSQLSFVPRGKC